MKLIEYCTEIFKDRENQLRNGIPCSEENVAKMLKIIRETLIEGLNKNPNNIIPEINQLHKKDDGTFSKTNPADIIAITFEVTVEQNRNPSLWASIGGKEIRAEIASVLGTIFNGPHQLAPNPANGVIETNYQDAKIKLTELLKKRYTPFH